MDIEHGKVRKPMPAGTGKNPHECTLLNISTVVFIGTPYLAIILQISAKGPDSPGYLGWLPFDVLSFGYKLPGRAV